MPFYFFTDEFDNGPRKTCNEAGHLGISRSRTRDLSLFAKISGSLMALGWTTPNARRRSSGVFALLGEHRSVHSRQDASYQVCNALSKVLVHTGRVHPASASCPRHQLVRRPSSTLLSSRLALKTRAAPSLTQHRVSVASLHTSLSHTVTSQPRGSESLLEEETLPDYDVDEFYPVRIYERLYGRYLVLGKLGYGANSTVWLCRDLQ